jgi:hypothetical protein
MYVHTTTREQEAVQEEYQLASVTVEQADQWLAEVFQASTFRLIIGTAHTTNGTHTTRTTMTLVREHRGTLRRRSRRRSIRS